MSVSPAVEHLINLPFGKAGQPHSAHGEESGYCSASGSGTPRGASELKPKCIAVGWAAATARTAQADKRPQVSSPPGSRE